VVARLPTTVLTGAVSETVVGERDRSVGAADAVNPVARKMAARLALGIIRKRGEDL
jgi:hypothetical protein